MYSMIKELKRKAFRVKSRNIEEAIGVQVTFIPKNKHQKKKIYQILTIFWAIYMHPFWIPAKLYSDYLL